MLGLVHVIRALLSGPVSIYTYTHVLNVSTNTPVNTVPLMVPCVLWVLQS